MIFLTSDTHFGHDREFLFGPRGFTNIHDHDETIIANWNSVVGTDDIVYHLGDVMLNDNEHGMECLKRLNGQIKIIIGNHDTAKRVELYKTLPNVEVIGYATVIKYKKYNIYLSHHPTMTSNLEGSAHLREHLLNMYGHTHQRANFYEDRPYMHHVGLDSHNNTPVSIDDALEIMKRKVRECLAMLGEEDIMASAAMPILAPATPDPQELLRPNLNVNFNFTVARCEKCVYTYPACGSDDSVGQCPKYHRDPPDGGFYG